MALHSLLFSLYCSLKISLVLSLKQYRPYVLNLAFGLEVISATGGAHPGIKSSTGRVILVKYQLKAPTTCEYYGSNIPFLLPTFSSPCSRGSKNVLHKLCFERRIYQCIRIFSTIFFFLGNHNKIKREGEN